MNQPPPWTPQWSAPPPSRQPGQLRIGRVWLGVGLAALGHALTIGVMLLTIAVTRDTRQMGTFNGVFAGLAAQAVLFVVALVASILLVTRGDRSLGFGIIIGWAVGLLFAPVVGIGICVAALNSSGVS